MYATLFPLNNATGEPKAALNRGFELLTNTVFLKVGFLIILLNQRDV